MQSWDFLGKLLFTGASLGSCFKGGEVTPLFYIGSTLANALGPLLHMPFAISAVAVDWITCSPLLHRGEGHPCLADCDPKDIPFPIVRGGMCPARAVTYTGASLEMSCFGKARLSVKYM